MEEKKIDSLQKRYAIKLLSNFVSGFINLLMIAIVPKELGPIAYGQFSYLQQFYNQIISFLDASTSIAFFTKLSANNSRKKLVSFYMFFCFFVFIFLYLIIFVLERTESIGIVASEIELEYIYLGMWFGFLTWFTQVYIKISDAYALTISVELIKIIHKILMLFILIFIIHFFTFELYTYFYFHFLSLISFIVFLTVLFHRENIFYYSYCLTDMQLKSLVKEFYIFCSPLFMFNCIAIGAGLLDVWLLQKVSGSKETGYYGLAYSIAAMCFVFTSAMTPVITREFSKSFAEKNIKEMAALFQRYVPMLYMISVFFSVFVAFEAESLLALFTDERFMGAYFALVVIAFYPIHQMYGQINAALFFATEDTITYRNTGLIGLLLGALLSYLFIYKIELGALGFALKMVISQVLLVNVQLYINAKKLNLSYLHFFIHQLYSLLLFCIIAYFSSRLINIESSLIGSFLIKGIFYTLLALLMVCIFPQLMGLSRKNMIKKIFFKR